MVVQAYILIQTEVGKATHVAREIAQLLGTGMGFVSMSSLTAGWVLSGSSSQWKNAKPGKVFEAIVDGQYANPVLVVDEIDKASGDAQYDPLGALYSLLEHDTAQNFTDEFAEVPIDASQAAVIREKRRWYGALGWAALDGSAIAQIQGDEWRGPVDPGQMTSTEL